MHLTLVVVLTVSSAFFASAHSFYDDDLAAWTNLIDSGELPPLDILSNSILPKKPTFPSLTQKQRGFAVNPGLQSFYDPRFKDVEEVAGPAKSLSHDEEAADPLGPSDDKHHNPKKASERPIAMAQVSRHEFDQERMNDIYFTTTVAASAALAVFAIVGAGFCYRRVRRNSKASEDVEYPAYGLGGAGKDHSPTSGTDRKLAQNAQMYHYQHQKQQMIAFDSAKPADPRSVKTAAAAIASDCESDDGEEGDYTVYECPGLAPAGEMEVHNPLFHDDPTPKAK